MPIILCTHFILLRQVHCHHHRWHALPVVTQQLNDNDTTTTKEREHLAHASYDSPTFNDPIDVEFPDKDESFIAPVEVEMSPSKLEIYVKGSL